MVRGHTWYDNSWWEAELPLSWEFREDRSCDRGMPYVFESPNGTRLRVNASGFADDSRYDFSLAPSGLTQGQKTAFIDAAKDALVANSPPLDYSNINPLWLAFQQHLYITRYSSRLAASASRLTRMDAGELVGFTYPYVEADAKGWGGCFSHERWMLRISFLAPSSAPVQESDTAKAIIASMCIKSPASI